MNDSDNAILVAVGWRCQCMACAWHRLGRQKRCHVMHGASRTSYGMEQTAPLGVYGRSVLCPRCADSAGFVDHAAEYVPEVATESTTSNATVQAETYIPPTGQDAPEKGIEW